MAKFSRGFGHSKGHDRPNGDYTDRNGAFREAWKAKANKRRKMARKSRRYNLQFLGRRG